MLIYTEKESMLTLREKESKLILRNRAWLNLARQHTYTEKRSILQVEKMQDFRQNDNTTKNTQVFVGL